MKKGKITTTLLLLLTVGSLCACGGSDTIDPEVVKTSRVTKDTVGAIKAEESNVISLDGHDITIANNYRVSVQTDPNTEITTYFVFNPEKANEIADARDGRSGDDYERALRDAWDEAQRLIAEQTSKNNFFGGKTEETTIEPAVFVFDTDAYTTAYHENVSLYIYSGLDRTTPAVGLKDYQIKASCQAYMNGSLGANVQLRNVMWDVTNVPQIAENPLFPEVNDIDLNGDFYVMTFTANAGDYETTTYGEQVFPQQYFGIYLMEKEMWQGSFRRWYGFVFTNDGVGDIMDEEAYDDIMTQLKTEFEVTRYYTAILDTTAWNYDKLVDYRYGRNYEQLSSLFGATKNYYIMFQNKTLDINATESKTP